MTIEIRVKRGTAAYLAELNPVLEPGEPCLETDTNKVKYGDGTTPWNLLAYATGADINSGTNNEITGTDGFIGGGNTNTVSGLNGFIGGGADNTVSGANAAVLAGAGSSATAANSLAIGKQAVASSFGQVAISSGAFNTPGDAQFSIYNLRGQTTSDAATVLALDGVASYSSGVSTARRLEVPIGVIWNFDIKVTAYDITTDVTAVWTIRGGVKRGLGGDGVVFVGSPIIENTAENDWSVAAGISVRATADDDVEPYTLAIDATGAAGKTIYWYATALISQLMPKPPLTSDMFVEVSASAQITTLDVSIDGSSGSLMPAFNPSIQDYCIYSDTNGTDAYSLTINGANTTGSIDVNKALHVTYGAQEYFIRVIPTDLPMVTVQTKTAGYRPGYYLYNPSQGNGANYFIVFNENGTPVWYTHDDRHNGSSLHCTVPNKLVLHTWGDATRYAVELGLNQMTATNYTMKNDSSNSQPIWECHESHMIAGPEGRRGNFISMTYAYGCTGTYMPNNELYIQELSADGQTIVWDWHSDEYFNIGPHYDYFHANSIDVHPVTGDLLISCRHPGGAFCIDYATKEVKWALQGVPCCSDTGTFQNVARGATTQNTKWLTVYNDPYTGPAGNHDARWHSADITPLTPGNEIITLYDDQTDHGNYARGVTYEIDLANNRGIFRAHAHSTSGTSPYQGGFTLVKELDGSYSHVADFIYENPAIVEFNNGTNLDPNQNIVFSVSIPGNLAYRAVKVRPDFLDINFMRTTAGRTLVLP